MDMKKILQYAMAAELRGQMFYSSNADLMKNEGSKTVFNKLSQMEAEHQVYIKNYADKIGISLEEVNENDAQHFEKRFIETSPKGSFDSDLGDVAALRLAYLIEHDIAEFYKKAAERADDEASRKLLLELAGWEDEHEKMILEEYNEVKDRVWGDAGFSPF